MPNDRLQVANDGARPNWRLPDWPAMVDCDNLLRAREAHLHRAAKRFGHLLGPWRESKRHQAHWTRCRWCELGLVIFHRDLRATPFAGRLETLCPQTEGL